MEFINYKFLKTKFYLLIILILLYYIRKFILGIINLILHQLYKIIKYFFYFIKIFKKNLRGSILKSKRNMKIDIQKY